MDRQEETIIFVIAILLVSTCLGIGVYFSGESIYDLSNNDNYKKCLQYDMELWVGDICREYIGIDRLTGKRIYHYYTIDELENRITWQEAQSRDRTIVYIIDNANQ